MGTSPSAFIAVQRMLKTVQSFSLDVKGVNSKGSKVADILMVVCVLLGWHMDFRAGSLCWGDICVSWHLDFVTLPGEAN